MPHKKGKEKEEDEVFKWIEAM